MNGKEKNEFKFFLKQTVGITVYLVIILLLVLLVLKRRS